MRKIIKIILISFLTLNLSFTSFASNAQPENDGDLKPGVKIVPTESFPVNNSEDQSKDSDKKDGNRAADPQQDPGKKEDTNTPKGNEPKNEDSAYKDKKDNKEKQAEVKEGQTDKKPNQDMERIEKVVDDLVTKLDKNSNLSKALAEMQAQNANTSNKDVSQQTEAVLKDYNKKIQTASTAKERKKLENEAAKKIQSLSKDQGTASSSNTTESDLDANIPEKKKKILLEVKSDKVEEEDRNQILALNPTNEVEEEEVFFLENPLVIITLIFIIALLVAIGIVIRNNEKKEKRKSNKK